MPQMVELFAGEEHELSSQRSKLLELQHRWWEVRGLGDFKLLLNKRTGSVRFLMREETTLKILGNFYVVNVARLCEIKANPSNDNVSEWSAYNCSCGVLVLAQLVLVFASVEEAKEVTWPVPQITEQQWRPDHGGNRGDLSPGPQMIMEEIVAELQKELHRRERAPLFQACSRSLKTRFCASRRILRRCVLGEKKSEYKKLTSFFLRAPSVWQSLVRCLCHLRSVGILDFWETTSSKCLRIAEKEKDYISPANCSVFRVWRRSEHF